MRVIKGKELRVFIEDENGVLKPFFHAISCKLSYNTTFAKIVTKQTAGGEDWLPERIIWSVSGNGLMVLDPNSQIGFRELATAWRYKRKVHIAIKIDDSVEISGDAYIESLEDEATATTKAQTSYQFKCVGMPVLYAKDDDYSIFDDSFDETFE